MLIDRTWEWRRFRFHVKGIYRALHWSYKNLDNQSKNAKIRTIP